MSNYTCTVHACTLCLPNVHMYIILVSIALVKKYAKVIQNYYLKFMGGFDAAQMREIVMV